MDSKERQRTLELLERAVEERTYLLRVSDVLGYAVGFRVKDGETTEEPVLTVYVRKGRKAKDPEDHPPHQRIPSRIRLKVGKKWVWLPVDIVESEVGSLSAGPVQAGLSVGNSRKTDSGSIGWIARTDDEASAPVFCSAFHVLLRFPPNGSKLTGTVDKQYQFTFPNFENVVSPSVEDGGDVAQDNVGHVMAGRRNNVVDVAVVSPRDAASVEAVARDIGPIGPARFLTASDLHPTDPVQVRIRGRSTTQVTTAQVVRFPAAHLFAYPDRPNGLLLFQLIETNIETQAGDSGTLLLDDQRRPLGMLVGRAGGSSFFMHIQSVINAMKLKDF